MTSIIIFNWLGMGICVIGFGLAFLAQFFLGSMSEGQLMIIAGPIIAILDIAYRLRSKDKSLLKSSKGGSLFFLPAWCFGLLWLILGIVYALREVPK